MDKHKQTEIEKISRATNDKYILGSVLGKVEMQSFMM